MSGTADDSDTAGALSTLDDVRGRRCRSERVWHRLRRHVVTSTEFAALFEASPNLKPFALWWHEQGSLQPGKPATAAMRLGLQLEGAGRRIWEHGDRQRRERRARDRAEERARQTVDDPTELRRQHGYRHPRRWAKHRRGVRRRWTRTSSSVTPIAGRAAAPTGAG